MFTTTPAPVKLMQTIPYKDYNALSACMGLEVNAGTSSYDCKGSVRNPMENSTDYEIVRATIKDYDRIARFLKSNFFRSNPMYVALGLPEGTAYNDQIHGMDNIEKGNFLIATVGTRDGSRRIVGICLNSESTPEDGRILKELQRTCHCRKVREYLGFLTTAEANANVWKRTGVKKALAMHALTVDSTMRGLGVGKELVEQSRRMAKEQGYQVLRMDCSSYFSARIARNLGMEFMYSLRYDEYMGENGLPAFVPPPPHEAFEFYVEYL